MSARCFSLNQVEHSARKAVRGVGLSWGLAEDTGRAVRWLQAAGLDGVSALVQVLTQLDAEPLAGRAGMLVPHDYGWRARGPGASLIGGAVIADCIVANDLACSCRDGVGNQRLQLEALPVPILSVGFAGVASMQSGIQSWLEWDGVLTEFSPDGAEVQGSETGLMVAAASVSLLLERPAGFHPDFRLSPQHDARLEMMRIDPAIWVALEQFAYRTYVPATEASRHGGAGAGTLDND